MFIDDIAARLLDNLYRLTKDYAQSKKTAEKIIKDLIKTVIKIGILYRNDQLTQGELDLADEFRRKFRTVAMTVISFYQVDFSFDKNFLSSALGECAGILKQLVQRNLTEKSLGRIDNVFTFYSNAAFLEVLFRANGPYREVLGKIVTDLNTMVEQDAI